MDALTLIILVVAALALLRGSLQPTQPPQIIYVQPTPAEPAGGLGCLPAGAMFLILLVLTGIVKI